MNTDYIALPDAAKNAGITVDKARHWANQLGVEITKASRVRRISATGGQQLASMAALVSGGRSPQEAAAILLATPCTIPVQSDPTPSLDTAIDPILSGQSDIQQAVLAIAESFRTEVLTVRGEVVAVREEVARLATDNLVLAKQNQRLLEEIQSLRKCLDYKPAVAPVIPVAHPMVPAAPPRSAPTWASSFHQAVVETQEWMRGVLAPFMGVFRRG
ncbi:MAG: hypothetical protein HQM09_24065 [Candidatus Riflebacteria bacterium]|nr:hypothetical protein [Candidatus Riflebacteria bacterium]